MSLNMKRGIAISIIVTGVFSALNLVFGISFTLEELNTVLIIAFGLLVFVYILRLITKIWMRLVMLVSLSLILVFTGFIWQIYGYTSRTHQTWEFNKHDIQLQHRLGIAGPGGYWFLVNRKLFWGVMKRRIEERSYQAKLPDSPRIFKFVTSFDTLIIECCETDLFGLPDSMTNKEKLEYLRQ